MTRIFISILLIASAIIFWRFGVHGWQKRMDAYEAHQRRVSCEDGFQADCKILARSK